MKVWVHPDALAELTQAKNFYLERVGLHLAENFINEFERVTQLLQTYPGFGTPDSGGIRKQTLRRYPYMVVYKILSDELRVLAVAHQSRKPGFWRARQ